MNTYALVLADLDSARSIPEQRIRSRRWRALSHARIDRHRAARSHRRAA